MEDMSLVYNINLCRICQTPDNLNLINTSTTPDKDERTYLDILKYIFDDIMWVEDQFISVACKTCLFKITDIAEFKRICKETNYRRELLNFQFIKDVEEIQKVEVDISLDDNQDNDSTDLIEVVVKENNIKSRKRKTIIANKKQTLKRRKVKYEEEESESYIVFNEDDIKIEYSDSDSDYEPLTNMLAKNCKTVKKSTRLKKESKSRNKFDRKRNLGITCDICNIACISIAERDRHVYNQHDGVRTHICKICGKGYITKDDLSGHIKTVHADKEKFKFECEDCGAKFYKVSALQRHIAAHHNTSDTTDKFSCTLCECKYTTKGNLKVHLLSHSCIKEQNENLKSETEIKLDNPAEIAETFNEIPNTYCEPDITSGIESEDANSRSTKSEQDKILPILGERKRKPKPHTINIREKKQPKSRNKTDRTRTLGITCDICKIPCASLAERDRHVYNQHDGVRTHICAICGRGYITKDDLTGHMKIVHADKEEYKYLCTECGAKFYKLSVLQKHTEIRHKHIRKFSCTACGRLFTTNGNLKSHMLTHTEAREFKCQLCPAEYKRKDCYLIHMTQKHGIGNYKCNRNSKEKNHACTMCEQRFNTRPRLLAHIRKHHTDVEPFITAS